MATLKEALNQARVSLQTRNIEDASFESELLLRHTLKITRAQLYANPDRILTREEETTFWVFVKRRLNLEPLAYIARSREFYGLSFYVDHRVLIPRPETELLVEETIKSAQNYPSLTIADIGTGAGAIAISLALNLPQAKIYATDISKPALEVARINAERHKVSHRIELLEGNLLEPLPGPFDLVVANLPYVTGQELAKTEELGWEPQVALYGGQDGLDKIRELLNQLEKKNAPKGSVFLEVGLGQAKTVTRLFKHYCPEACIEALPDLGGITRVITLIER